MPIQLINRSAGQVILQTFFNDIISALEGDFVGRDNSGNPVSGNNLGTSAYPWGNLYCNQAIIGGTALNTAILENPAYQIVSGKTRSGSNQPAFLSPAGSALNFSLLASSTNLVLQIAGVSATWTSDKTGIAGVAAPSTQNTATVNDSTASGQGATRTWGEYGTGSNYYAITISSVGTNITARVGSVQAFKIGTEYFLATIETSTSLSRAFRGFFFDSSGNPVKRSTISNGATITLMNLGYVFADANGSTVDTIFTGLGVNNTPTYAFTAPASPLTGDYWYDLGNNQWKRYAGSWTVVSRILVGLVVCDSSNCVAARSLDFYGLCRTDNTIELTKISTTQLEATGIKQRVNVNGKRIDFATSRPIWDTASNLAASTERYNASVTASVTEYFYVTDQGDLKISDMEPYWRPDLLGWYHPYNPWRQVSQNLPDGSAQFQGGFTLNRGSVQKVALGQQTSSSSGNFTTTSGSYVDVTNLTVEITTTGRPVYLALMADGSSASTLQIVGTANSQTQLLRGSTSIAIVEVSANTSTTVSVPPPFLCIDTPAPGTYTYKIQTKSSTGANTVSVSGCVLVAFEL